MKKLVRSVVLPLLLLLGAMPGSMQSGRVAPSGSGSSTGANVHMLSAGAATEATTALQQGSATSIAHLGIAPRQAWHSRHEHLKPKWDIPVRALAPPSRFDTHDAYVAMIRIAVTGSVAFRATSLPPPTL